MLPFGRGPPRTPRARLRRHASRRPQPHQPRRPQPRRLERGRSELGRPWARGVGEPHAVVGDVGGAGGGAGDPPGRVGPRRGRPRLRHGLLVRLVPSARRSPGRARPLRGAAGHRPGAPGRARDRVSADPRERRGAAAAGCLLRRRLLRVRRRHLVRPVRVDSRGPPAAAAGRPADLPVQLGARDALFAAERYADGGDPGAATARPPQHRVAGPGRHRLPPAPQRANQAAARHRLRGRGAPRALRLRWRPGELRYFMRRGWAQQWPCEEVWVARRR